MQVPVCRSATTHTHLTVFKAAVARQKCGLRQCRGNLQITHCSAGLTVKEPVSLRNSKRTHAQHRLPSILQAPEMPNPERYRLCQATRPTQNEKQKVSFMSCSVSRRFKAKPPCAAAVHWRGVPRGDHFLGWRQDALSGSWSARKEVCICACQGEAPAHGTVREGKQLWLLHVLSSSGDPAQQSCIGFVRETCDHTMGTQRERPWCRALPVY